MIGTPDGQVSKGKHGGEDVRALPPGSVVEQTVMDDTLPCGPQQKVRHYVAPLVSAHREAHYRIAWAFLAGVQPQETS